MSRRTKRPTAAATEIPAPPANPGQSRAHGALPLAMAALALLLLGAGGFQLARESEDSTPQNAVPGSKPPSAVGLPDYPGATGFSSTEVGTDVLMTTFRVPKAPARSIASFYLEKLEPLGYRLQWRRAPISLEHGPKLRGDYLRWQNAAEGRQVTLQAIDPPTGRGDTQVTLTWGPSTG